MKKLVYLLILSLCMNGMAGVSSAWMHTAARAEEAAKTEKEVKAKSSKDKKGDKKKDKKKDSKKKDQGKSQKDKKKDSQDKSKKEKETEVKKEKEYTLDLAKNSTVQLSDIIKYTKLSIKLKEIKKIQFENKEDKEYISWEHDPENKDDYVFTVLKNFKEVRLRIVTKKDSKLIVLLNGSKAKKEDKKTGKDAKTKEKSESTTSKASKSQLISNDNESKADVSASEEQKEEIPAEKPAEEKKEASEEKPTEEKKEASEEKPAEEKKEASEEKPTEEKKEASEEKPAEEKEEASEEKPAEEKKEASEEKPAEEKKEASEEKPTEEKKEASEEKPAEEKKEASEEKLTEEKKEASEEKPAEEKKEATEENPAEEKKEATEEKPTEEKKEASEEKPAEEKKEASEEKPTEQQEEAPAEKPTEEKKETPAEDEKQSPEEQSDEREQEPHNPQTGEDKQDNPAERSTVDENEIDLDRAEVEEKQTKVDNVTDDSQAPEIGTATEVAGQALTEDGEGTNDISSAETGDTGKPGNTEGAVTDGQSGASSDQSDDSGTAGETEGTQGTVDDTQSEPGAGDGTTQQDALPTQEGETPTQEGETPTQEGEIPAQEGEIPTQEGETPTQEGEPPAQEGETPTQEGETPAQEGETPAQEGETPAQEGETPTQEGETPAQEGETPTQEDETPTQEDETPTQEDETPTQEDETPGEDGSAQIPADAEAWLKRGTDLIWGTLGEIIGQLNAGDTVNIQSNNILFVQDVPLQLMSSVTLIPDPGVFKSDYIVCISTDNPEIIAQPVLIQPTQMTEMGEKADLFIWVKQNTNSETEGQGAEEDKPTIEVKASGLAETGWSTTQPQFMLYGIPEGKSWTFAAIIYDERFVPISSNVYVPDTEGIYTVRFAMLDELGDIMSASDQYTLQLDWTAPNVSASADEETSFTLNISATDDVSGVNQVSVDGGQTWYKMEDGSYTVTKKEETTFAAGDIRVSDVAGNVYISEEEITVQKVESEEEENGENGEEGGGGGGGGGDGGSGSGTPALPHSSGDGEEGAEYDSLTLDLPDGPMKQLTVGGEALALRLILESAQAPSAPVGDEQFFTAELRHWADAAGDDALNTLILNAETDEDLGDEFSYEWRFNGEVYRLLANSGIKYVALKVDNTVAAFPTEGFTGGTKYTELKMQGISTRKFDYTLTMKLNLDPSHISAISENDYSQECDLAIRAEVEDKNYELSNSPQSMMYYYNVFLGSEDMMDQPFGEYHAVA